MSSMEEFIRTQNRIREQFAVPKAVAALTMDGSMQAYASATKAVASIQVEPAILGFAKELQKYREMHESVYKSFSAVQQVLRPVLEEYNRVSEVVSVAKKVQESIQPITNYLKDIQPVLPDTKVLSQLAEIRSRILLEPSILLGLQEAVESHINTSIWEYEEKSDYLSESLTEEMQEDILILTEAEDKVGFLSAIVEKWGEKGKKVIIAFIKAIIIAFFSGLFQKWCEPVYKVLTPSFLLQEENADTENKIEIPVNTEVHVWNDITNNFVEITYKIDEKEYQGYMEQGEFEANTEKISDEVKLEHIIFINDVTQMLSEKWNIQPEQVYSFLKGDTDLLNNYLIKHYDVLELLDETDLIGNIEKYCEDQGILIPTSEECNDCEYAEIE